MSRAMATRRACCGRCRHGFDVRLTCVRCVPDAHPRLVAATMSPGAASCTELLMTLGEPRDIPQVHPESRSYPFASGAGAGRCGPRHRLAAVEVPRGEAAAHPCRARRHGCHSSAMTRCCTRRRHGCLARFRRVQKRRGRSAVAPRGAQPDSSRPPGPSLPCPPGPGRPG